MYASKLLEADLNVNYFGCFLGQFALRDNHT